MNDYRESLIQADNSVKTAMQVIEASLGKIAIVVDAAGRLLGTVTDGDIRRAILAGQSLDGPIGDVMFTTPVTGHVSELSNPRKMLQKMHDLQIRQMPLLDDEGRVAGLEFSDHLRAVQRRDNLVVLMAGGEGQRLRPLTLETPKPMLNIGPRPILETIIQNFVEAGFRDFMLSVNYKAEVIMDYFGDGSDHGANIQYLREDKPLDTAGALSLIKERPDASIIVMNGDILTKVQFDKLLDFHDSHQALATMCVREFGVTLPYGVVYSDNMVFEKVEEKPHYSWFVNAGIYAFSPAVLDRLAPNTALSMTDLFVQLQAESQKCMTYPLHEYWLDIGKIEDYNRALEEFSAIF